MTPFIVAEMSANHLGSWDRACAIVDAAAEAGADAVKLQTWAPDTMCVDRCYTLESGPWAGRKLFDLYREAFTPWHWHAKLFERIRSHGMVPFSAPFDCESADFLETLGVDRYKIASFELTDLPLIRHVASKGRPMIISTGMASHGEICAALDAIYAVSPTIRSMLVHCVSAYPADASQVGLGRVDGLSDHTPGIGVSVAAVALGAVYIEKHLTLARSAGGPDAGFSLEPDEFKQLATECRRAAAAVQPVPPGPRTGEDKTLRRGLWAVQDIQPGEPLILGGNVRTARPALGLPPSFDLAGKHAAMAIPWNSPLTAECVA